MLRVFRRFLKGDAYEYWCSLDEDVQSDWEQLKPAFKEKFGVSKSVSAAQRMQVKNQVMSLKQGNRHISEYIRDAQSLSLKVPKELDELLALAFIGGMKDQTKKERISFAVTSEAEHDGGVKFTRVVELVKSTYMIIGQPSMLERSVTTMTPAAAASPTTSPDKMDEVIRLLKGLQGTMPRGNQWNNSQQAANVNSESQSQALVPFGSNFFHHQLARPILILHAITAD